MRRSLDIRQIEKTQKIKMSAHLFSLFYLSDIYSSFDLLIE